MKRTRFPAVVLLSLIAVSMIGCDDDCDDWWGDETNLVVANLSSGSVGVSIDEDQNGCVRYLGVLQPGATGKWEVDAGWAWVFIDGDAVEIYLDSDYDGWLEIRE